MIIVNPSHIVVFTLEGMGDSFFEFVFINENNLQHTKHFSLMTCTKVTLNFGSNVTKNEMITQKWSKMVPLVAITRKQINWLVT